MTKPDSQVGIIAEERIRFRTLDGFVYQSRWLIYPINCGLMVALAAYILTFVWNVGLLVVGLPQVFEHPEMATGELMIDIVGLLDQAMLSALLVLTIMGNHQIYVRRFKYQHRADSPQWLDHIDTIMLKVKLGLAFVGVSSVVLLEDAVSARPVTPAVWQQHVAVHAVFLGTTLVVAIVWRLMKSPLK